MIVSNSSVWDKDAFNWWLMGDAARCWWRCLVIVIVTGNLQHSGYNSFAYQHPLSSAAWATALLSRLKCWSDYNIYWRRNHLQSVQQTNLNNSFKFKLTKLKCEWRRRSRRNRYYNAYKNASLFAFTFRVYNNNNGINIITQSQVKNKIINNQ